MEMMDKSLQDGINEKRTCKKCLKDKLRHLDFPAKKTYTCKDCCKKYMKEYFLKKYMGKPLSKKWDNNSTFFKKQDGSDA
jgi:hypothetical protein